MSSDVKMTSLEIIVIGLFPRGSPINYCRVKWSIENDKYNNLFYV
jgi:hypothetical protein